MNPSDIFQNSKEATPEELKAFWTRSSVHDRKMFINMRFNNSKGSEEKVLAFLEIVGESDTKPYIDYYNGCRKNAKPIEGKS